MTLGKKLQSLRNEKNISQEELALELGVSRQAVSKWELDASMPDTANIIHLCKFFAVSADYLLNEKVEGGRQGYSCRAKEHGGIRGEIP